MDRQTLAACSDAELDDTIGQLHGVAMAANAHMLAFISAFDEREAYRADGASSMEQWLARRLGVAHATAVEWVRVARALEDLPTMWSNHALGVLSWDQVRIGTRIATPETDQRVADSIPDRSVASLQVEARRATAATSQAQAAEDLEMRTFRMYTDPSGRFGKFWGRLPIAEFAVFSKALDRIVDLQPREPETGLYAPLALRRADALIELASQRLSEDADPDRATVVVHVDAAALVARDHDGSLEDGTPVPIDAVLRMACDSRLQAVVHAADGTPIGVGRASRTVRPSLSREVRRRDGARCQFPGCGRTKGLQAHHWEIHWVDGGPTDHDNLILLCAFHHRLMHEGGWRFVRDESGRLRVLRPDGLYLPVGPPELRPEVRDRLPFPIGSSGARAP